MIPRIASEVLSLVQNTTGEHGSTIWRNQTTRPAADENRGRALL